MLSAMNAASARGTQGRRDDALGLTVGSGSLKSVAVPPLLALQVGVPAPAKIMT